MEYDSLLVNHTILMRIHRIVFPVANTLTPSFQNLTKDTRIEVSIWMQYELIRTEVRMTTPFCAF